MFGKRGDPGHADDVRAAPVPPPAAERAIEHDIAVPDLPPPGGDVAAAPAIGPDDAEVAAVAPAAPPTPPPAAKPRAAAAKPAPKAKTAGTQKRSNEYYAIKTTIFNALIDAIDLAQLAQLDRDAARDEIRDIVNEIISIKDVVMSISEQEELLEDICNDVLGYGPLEPLLARDDIADIMVNGAERTFIEVDGKVEETDVRFRDNGQLMNICQRIVSQVGRRVDEASPICDARLPDGSRVNVIAPPLAIDGAVLTIRKFKKDKLKMADLVNFGSITPEGAKILAIIGKCRCNVIISGGTGSGKTTLLNALTAFVETDERVITCEDSAELQLQQPHVVRLETRPPNLEGEGEITMRDLVKNCLRMRPERIIVGEVRGPEAFDLLQAMNTGHDGSMGTLHANNPGDALSRLETMALMSEVDLPLFAVRGQIASAVDLIVQMSRHIGGRRLVTQISEVRPIDDAGHYRLKDIFTLKPLDDDPSGNLVQLAWSGERSAISAGLGDGLTDLLTDPIKPILGMD